MSISNQCDLGYHHRCNSKACECSCHQDKKPKQYIYARVSTKDQNHASQLLRLKEVYPEAIVIEEEVSGADVDKPVQAELLARLQPGDTLIVYSVDRLGRRIRDLIAITEDLYARKINLITFKEKLDFSTYMGRFMAHIFMAQAELEREVIRERIENGKTAAKKRGVHIGGVFKREEDVAEIRKLHAEGVSKREISKKLGIARGTVLKYTNLKCHAE